MYTHSLDFRFWHAIIENSGAVLDTTYGILRYKSLVNITVLFSLFAKVGVQPLSLIGGFSDGQKTDI